MAKMQKDNRPDTLGFTMVSICRMHRARADQMLEGLGLYQGQPPVLRALWIQEGLTQTELIDRLKIAPATMTKMLQRMEKAGFIQRRMDEQDQRVSRVYLTGQGRAVQEQVEAIFRRLDDETFGNLNPEDQTQLHALLKRVRDNLQRIANEAVLK
jgi:MarR family transcriptional regulator, organic hydroperoxide resistance regulator